MASESGLSVKRCGLDRLLSVVPYSLPPVPDRFFDLLVDGFVPLLRVTLMRQLSSGLESLLFLAGMSSNIFPCCDWAEYQFSEKNS